MCFGGGVGPGSLGMVGEGDRARVGRWGIGSEEALLDLAVITGV